MSADKHDDDAAGETLEEAGALEADVGANFDQQLAGIDPRLKINMDPMAHRDLRPEMMFIREELRQAKWQTLARLMALVSPPERKRVAIDHLLVEERDKRYRSRVRRTALKKLLLKDFMQEDCELRNIGLAYAPPDP